MTPFKRTRVFESTPIRKKNAYVNTSVRKLAKSERFLNDLMAKNLTERFKNDSVQKSDQNLETTFDRLLNGEVYNEVVYKNFPEHKFNCESTFYSSNDSSRLNQSPEKSQSSDFLSIDKLKTISPISTRNRRKERNLSLLFVKKNNTMLDKEKNESEQENNCHKINDLRLQVVLPRISLRKPINEVGNNGNSTPNKNLYVVDKGTFMDSLHLSALPKNVSCTKNKSLLDNSTNASVNAISKENREKENIQEGISKNDNVVTDEELSERRDIFNCEGTTKQKFLRKSSRHHKPFIYNKFKKKLPFSSTPIRFTESAPNLSNNYLSVNEISPLERSYDEINLWNFKCPSPNSFITNKSTRINKQLKISKRSFLKEKLEDPKLMAKPLVVLDRISISGNRVNIKKLDTCENNNSVVSSEIVRKKSPKKYFTKRRKKEVQKKEPVVLVEPLSETFLQKQICLQQNPKVLLTQLEPFWIENKSVVDFIDLLSSEDEKSADESEYENKSLNKSVLKLPECKVHLDRIDYFLSNFQDNSSKSKNDTNFVYLNQIDLSDVSDKEPEMDVVKDVRVKQAKTSYADEELDLVESSVLFSPKQCGLIGSIPGKKFRRSIAVFKHTINSRLPRRTSIKMVPSVTGKAKSNELRSFVLNKSAGLSVVNVDDDSEDSDCSFQTLHTAEAVVLKRCAQKSVVSFESCYPPSVLERCEKIGEGVFGEVFMMRSETGQNSVMKIIPIEGKLVVNLERQKTFEEILSEIVITSELSNLRHGKVNKTESFVCVNKVRCVKGQYPEKLLELWKTYDEKKSSENDSPEIFDNDQKFIILELSDAGKDLEAYEFQNALQSFSIFKQVAFGLAVAENKLKFEHRDLHWGNVLVKKCEKISSIFTLDNKVIEVRNEGVTATIIDFTLSRIDHEGVVIFNDLSEDNDLFGAEGDYQFEIYRLMKKKNRNNWQGFEPYTNILWLHYILDKAICGFRYKTTKSKSHRSSIGKLRWLKSEILNFESAKDFVLSNFIY